MRRWWQVLAVIAGGLVSLGGLLSTATAQFPPPGFAGPAPPTPPQRPDQNSPTSPFEMLDDGHPNAFTSLLDVRVQRPKSIFPHWLSQHWHGKFPRLLHPTYTPAVAAEFPNPAQPSNDPVSPWTVREEGMANGFTDLADPRPRPVSQLFTHTRLLYTELLEPRKQVIMPYLITFRGEALNWNVTPGVSSVPLVTTTPLPNAAFIGQLSNQATQILVNSGSSTFTYPRTSTFRLGMGLSIGYLPPLEATGFSFRYNTTPFAGGSLTNPTQYVAIPFQRVDTAFLIPGSGGIGTESAYPVANPSGNALPIQNGVLTVSSHMDFWGVEALGLIPLGQSDNLKCDIVIGYRHLQMDESVSISTVNNGPGDRVFFRGSILPPLAQPPSLFQVSTSDRFATTNSFDGVQLGMRNVLTTGRWSLFSDAKVGLGWSRHTLNVAGSSTLTQRVPNRDDQTVNGGIFALPSNIGSASLSIPAIAPEVSLSLSYQATPHIRLYAGYNFLYWSTVARPGEFISNTIDARQIPTHPAFVANIAYNGPALNTNIVHRDFFIHGAFFGIEIGF